MQELACSYSSVARYGPYGWCLPSPLRFANLMISWSWMQTVKYSTLLGFAQWLAAASAA